MISHYSSSATFMLSNYCDNAACSGIIKEEIPTSYSWQYALSLKNKKEKEIGVLTGLQLLVYLSYDRGTKRTNREEYRSHWRKALLHAIRPASRAFLAAFAAVCQLAWTTTGLGDAMHRESPE